MYSVISLPKYDEAYKKLVKGDREKEKRAKKAVKLMRIDPFYPSLKSHKVITKHFRKCWSSWITGDLRIIWNFDTDNRISIYLLTIAVHSGTHKEYK